MRFAVAPVTIDEAEKPFDNTGSKPGVAPTTTDTEFEFEDWGANPTSWVLVAVLAINVPGAGICATETAENTTPANIEASRANLLQFEGC